MVYCDRPYAAASREGHCPMDGISFGCLCCGGQVLLCRACWRGQRYCSPHCTRLAMHSGHRQRQSKYSRTAKGRESQRRRDRRQRLKKTATDAGTKNERATLKVILPRRQGQCWSCGKEVKDPLMWQMVKARLSLRRLAFDFRRGSS